MRDRDIASILCTTMFVATAAAAEDIAHRFEITPLAGYRAGGDFDEIGSTDNPNIEPSVSYGLALAWRLDPERKLELLYDYQSSEIQDSGIGLQVEHLHLGGSASFNATDTFVPYIAGGLGATHLKPDSGADETRFSGSLGLGFEIPIGDRIGLRFEARGYLVSMDGNSELFCGSSAAGGACLVRAAGSTLFQYALLGGIAVKL